MGTTVSRRWRESIQPDYVYVGSAPMWDWYARASRGEDTNADLAQFKNAEWKRDKAAATKAKKSKRDLVAALGGLADQLVEIEQHADDAATKNALRSAHGLGTVGS